MIINAPDYPDVVSATAAMKDGDTLYFPSDKGPYNLPVGVGIDLSNLQGSVNAPSGQSVYGIYDRGLSRYCLFGAVTSNGTFSRAAVRVADVSGQTSWLNTLAQNSYPGGLSWQYGG